MEDFKAFVLSCGHIVHPYKGIGICFQCKKRCCEKCMVLVDDKLLCPTCFKEVK